jgi:hypothetical protein
VAGIGEFSHKKKAAFWRSLASEFPTLIDFFCNPKDLAQVASRCFFPLKGSLGGRVLMIGRALYIAG